MNLLPSRIRVVEVGPRDGLQSEAAVVSPADKIAFVDLLTAAGAPVIEAGAFVNPDRVPQMTDSAAVFHGIRKSPDVRYPMLVPNLRGLERAAEAGVTDIAIFAASSDTFSRRNINQGIDESLISYREVCREASARNMRIRAYLSTAFGCPYEGDVPPQRVADLSARLLDLGAFEVAVSDTIGIAHPGQVMRVVDMVADRVPRSRLALHFHDTRGTALANVLAAIDAGVTTFDASAGGLGGCPFAPGAAGNLATEDLVYMLDGLGIETGVRLAAVLEASRFIQSRVNHPLPSRFAQATWATERRRRSEAPPGGSTPKDVQV